MSLGDNFGRDDEFYEEAMSNTHSAISFETFSRNIELAEAKELDGEGAIIGPPVGQREFISQLNSVLLARNPVSLDSESLAIIQEKNSEWEATMPSTQDEIEAGRLGLYEPNPLLKNALGALEDSKEELLEELEKEIEHIYMQASYADPDVLFTRLQKLQQLMVQIGIGEPEISRDYERGGPGMGGMGF